MSERDDDETFHMWEGLKPTDGASEYPEGTALSNAAFMLHTSGIVNSIHYGTPGFVPDDYLNLITAETTTTVAELETAGLWRRADDGYEVLDRETVARAIEADERIRAQREAE